MGPLILVAALWATVFGVLAWVLAGRRARNRPLWAVLGILTGPIALAILQAAPPGRCPGCGSRVTGWEPVCRVCDRPFARRRATSRMAMSPDVVPTAEPTPAEVATVDARPTPRLEPAPVDARPTPLETPGEVPAPAPIRPAPPTASPPTTAGSTARAPEPARAVGVFVAGSQNLEIGARYLLALEGDQFTVTGPLHSSPARVCLTRRARDLDISAVGGQILLTARAGGRLAIAFNAIPGEDAARFEGALEAGNAT